MSKPASNTKHKSKSAKKPTAPKPLRQARHGRQSSGARPNRASSGSMLRDGTKGARIVVMLQARGGATIAAMMSATGWQPHSIRGFLAGVVRKRMSLNLVSEKTEQGRVYRIARKSAAGGRNKAA